MGIAGFLLAPHTFAAPVTNVAATNVAPTSDTLQTQTGVVRITPIFHATLQIEYMGKVIDADPVSGGSYTKKADLVLITHAHPDHFDKAAIQKVAGSFVHVVAPNSITSQLSQAIKSGSLCPLANGSILDFNTTGTNNKKLTIHIEAVPMYNLVRGPKPGQKFHPKGVGNGYILTLGGKRIYIAGDTEATPEMQHLKNIDIAFLPMNLPYTMTPQEAAKAARAFHPRIVYPYHYRYPFNKPNTNPQQFATALKGTGIQVRIRDWYPAAAVARATG
ncbi:MAG: MBL fold metallo-hydrolase [Abitibacteriaceae bacterium]|nr:MBL fold metallo-hydrolase [Abditibacteriaceae bacterium]MBV9867314.1 MBL fold metallo-hydrolase [Abditibacteriaceae bacterium]